MRGEYIAYSTCVIWARRPRTWPRVILQIECLPTAQMQETSRFIRSAFGYFIVRKKLNCSYPMVVGVVVVAAIPVCLLRNTKPSTFCVFE